MKPRTIIIWEAKLYWALCIAKKKGWGSIWMNYWRSMAKVRTKSLEFQRISWKVLWKSVWSRQVLGADELGRPRRIGWRGRWEGGSGWRIHVNPWLIHVNVWQNPLQYCKVISLQLIKINGKKKWVSSQSNSG